MHFVNDCGTSVHSFSWRGDRNLTHANRLIGWPKHAISPFLCCLARETALQLSLLSARLGHVTGASYGHSWPVVWLQFESLLRHMHFNGRLNSTTISFALLATNCCLTATLQDMLICLKHCYIQPYSSTLYQTHHKLCCSNTKSQLLAGWWPATNVAMLTRYWWAVTCNCACCMHDALHDF